MDQRSQFLAQALQAIGQPVAQTSQAGMSLQQMAAMGKQAKDWKAKNPGKSYIGSRFTQAGQNLMGAPGRMMDAVGMGQPQVQQQAAPQPLQGFQQSLQENGNALPEFTIPEWARDGTAADHPSNVSYLDMSSMPTPFGGGAQPASPGRGKGLNAQPSDPTAAAGAAGLLAKKAPGGLVAEALKSFLKG